jgi:hypothetical protein
MGMTNKYATILSTGVVNLQRQEAVQGQPDPYEITNIYFFFISSIYA